LTARWQIPVKKLLKDKTSYSSSPTSAAMLGANSPPSKLLIHHPPASAAMLEKNYPPSLQNFSFLIPQRAQQCWEQIYLRFITHRNNPQRKSYKYN
jgi:hypothetical protein